MRKRSPQKSIYGIRGVRIFLPFTLLLLGFSIASVIQRINNQEQVKSETADLQISPTTTAIFVATDITIKKQEPLETPTLDGLPQTERETAVPQVVTRISSPSMRLLGPPENSSFHLKTPLTVYWHWPHELEDNQKFGLYLLDESREYFVASTVEPSLGMNGYQLNFIPDKIVQVEGNYFVQIKLEQTGPAAIITASKPRAVAFTREN